MKIPSQFHLKFELILGLQCHQYLSLSSKHRIKLLLYHSIWVLKDIHFSYYVHEP